MKHSRRLLLSWIALWFPFGAGLGAQELAERDSTISIFFLDVGQGDATWIFTGGNRKQVLIDAGGSRAAIQRRLWENHRDTMDLVVATHAHDDHIGGMPWVFARYVVRAYMDNGIPHATDTYRRTLRSLETERGVTYLEATERTVTLGELVLRILPPSGIDSIQNDNSVGVLLEFGRFRALLTGDSEQRQIAKWLRENRIPAVHVLKAAHHGAANGFSADLARVARPATVVISAGKRNGYGHPSPRVVDAWRRAGATVLSTQTEGSVFIEAKLDGTHRIVRARALRGPSHDR